MLLPLHAITLRTFFVVSDLLSVRLSNTSVTFLDKETRKHSECYGTLSQLVV